MPSKRILSSNARIKLHNSLKFGDRIKVTEGKNKGVKGTVKSITRLNNDAYSSGRVRYQHDNYFQVYFIPDGKDKSTWASCNRVKKIREYKRRV